MKLYFLIITFATAEWLLLVSANYCASTLCSAGVQHVACNHTGKFDSTCSKDAAMVEMNATLRQVILNVHNNKRNYVAGGKVKKFKPACRMATMKWDAELAKIASYNVRQCKMNHDKCRNTAKYKYSGQNLAWRSFNGTPNKQELIKASINAWYSEVKDTKWEHIKSYPSNYNGPAIGHFTALMGERNIAVGCAAATYSTAGVSYKTFLIACNYATTNMVNNPIYNGCTKPAAKCKVGKNSKYPNLCAVKEVYNVNNWSA
ncbi:antigen 5 like allergen Cul n 1-like [Musca autumnalis]|uniref:antigen 5 like allergen Cul n 1-like n=1 Tax=Musca autumnalis TaxID=221902 RepID=UPI003CF5D02A